MLQAPARELARPPPCRRDTCVESGVAWWNVTALKTLGHIITATLQGNSQLTSWNNSIPAGSAYLETMPLGAKAVQSGTCVRFLDAVADFTSLPCCCCGPSVATHRNASANCKLFCHHKSRGPYDVCEMLLR